MVIDTDRKSADLFVNQYFMYEWSTGFYFVGDIVEAIVVAFVKLHTCTNRQINLAT